MEPSHPTRSLVEALCSDACAGRRPGTPGGLLARSLVVDALRAAGLDPTEQPAPGCGGANVVATIPGEIDRWVLVGAHYDHLGASGKVIYRGADDNAASVGILVDVARALTARRPDGRGVIFVAFDGEESPYYATGAMGSQQFARTPTVPLDRIDMMVAMELLGHPIGPEVLPDAVRGSVFALGAERSAGTSARVDALASAVDGITIRRCDAEVIPPLSDHLAFWQAGVPFMLLTGTRSSTYHTPWDTPDRLDWGRVGAISRWLEGFVRDQCARPEARVRFLADGQDDRSTLDAMGALLRPLAGDVDLARSALDRIDALQARCDAQGRLQDAERMTLQGLVAAIESALA
ncbi:MAG: M28 family peptidase [Deltaproteobacteria bacterium]|nr:M28 family peptidase [Myxococcales bacterium]MDP3220769.1 M28 family peptidase [Deltaproteobacteria bacterium]